MNNTATANQIRNLNDTFRKLEPFEAQVKGLGRWIFTSGVSALVASCPDQYQLVKMVQTFNEFTEGDDPHGEHDFFALEFMGSKVLVKIDYYDKAMEYGSEDPADASKTTRVMTLMTASEY
jgi:major membrane immunogen (membrane-anchored lipoprotein)